MTTPFFVLWLYLHILSWSLYSSYLFSISHYFHVSTFPLPSNLHFVSSRFFFSPFSSIASPFPFCPSPVLSLFSSLLIQFLSQLPFVNLLYFQFFFHFSIPSPVVLPFCSSSYLRSAFPFFFLNFSPFF